MNKCNEVETERRFSLSRFVAVVMVSLAGFLLALAFLAPAIWNIQLAASFPAFAGTFLAVHFVNAFAEFFFHRYVLHAPLVPLLTYFYKQHTRHHGLTYVVARKITGAGTGKKLRIENNYPIVEEAQHEASFFPWYAFSLFGIIWTPIFMLAQWFLASAPIFLAGYAALSWSLFLYEVLHSLEHLPLDKWQPLFERRRSGRWWKMFYAFHLRHHFDIRSNEAISGFFGLPVADLVFHTFVKPATLYENGGFAGADELKRPAPRFIGWLDKLAATKPRKRS
jgi:hemolysin III